MMPQRTFLMMLIVVCVTILCFVWIVRDSLCGLRLQQGNTVLVATLAYEVAWWGGFAETTDVKKPTGEVGFFTVPLQSWLLWTGKDSLYLT